MEVGHVNQNINELYDMIQNAKAVPLSSVKCMIERDAALDILDDILGCLPSELESAIKICEARNELVSQARRESESLATNAKREAEERQSRSRTESERIIADAKAEAERIIAKAKDEAQKMVTQESVYKEAQKQAKEMVDNATQKIEELKAVSNQYMDDALRQTEDTLAKTLNDVKSTRTKFNSLVGKKAPVSKTPAPNMAATQKFSTFTDIDV